MNKFKPSLLTLSLYAAGLSISSAPFIAHAEDTTQQAEQTDDSNLSKKERDEKLQKEKEIESISIKGFRGSVVKSLNTKRFSDTVVDAISADDIGGLPDVSIADALIRLPGVTSIRIDGQSSELNIRGLSGGFVFSTLNGREQVSASGGRNVQFDQYPSELIKQAQVYKSQKASLIEGGVAGTVELQTVNALDLEEDSQFRFSAHGNWNEAASDNSDSGSIGHRLTASYQTKLADDTFGVALGFARMFQPTVSSRFVNYQFDLKAENPPEGISPDPLTDVYDGAPESLLVSSGFELNERGGEDTRNAFVGAFNWDPTDSLRLQMDVFYSDFESGKWDRGLRVSGLNNITADGTGLILTDPVIANGALIGGTFSRDPNHVDLPPPYFQSSSHMNVQTQADDNSTDTQVFSWGFKANWDINDQATLSFDIGHSEAEETYKDRVMRMALFEDSSAETPVIDDDIVMTYLLDGTNAPTVTFNKDFTDLNKMMVTSAEAYPHIEENSADALRIDLNYMLDNDHISSIEVGFRASKREYEKDRGRFVYGTTDYNMRNGHYITYGVEVDENGNPYPVEIQRFAPFKLTSDMATVTSVGGDLSHMPAFLSVNNDEILNAWIPNVDTSPVTNWGHSWTMTQNNVIEEDVLAAYLQVNLDTELFGLPMTGNVGVRAVRTEQSSTGLINVGEEAGEPISDDLGNVRNDYIRGTRGIKYTDYLPSMNFNFSLTDDDQLRFAYAKVLSRPNMDKMANSGNFDFTKDNQTGEFLINLNSSTSPTLRPFYADQIDISYEHYMPETDGAIVFAVWNKDIKNFVDDVSKRYFDYSAAGINVPPVPEDKIIDPATGEPANWQNGTYTYAENNPDAGYIRGIEFAYTQSFKFLPGIWSGLGTNISYSYTESEITQESKVPGDIDSNGQPLTTTMEGISKRVYSATLFYNWDDKFETRVNVRHRSAYLDRQIAIGDSQSAYFNEETIWSAQMSYNFSEQLQAVMSMDNLTDEPNVSYFGDITRTGTIQYFGRTLYFGVNYKM